MKFNRFIKIPLTYSALVALFGGHTVLPDFEKKGHSVLPEDHIHQEAPVWRQPLMTQQTAIISGETTTTTTV